MILPNQYKENIARIAASFMRIKVYCSDEKAAQWRQKFSIQL